MPPAIARTRASAKGCSSQEPAGAQRLLFWLPPFVGIALRPNAVLPDGAIATSDGMLAGMAIAPGHSSLRQGRHSQPGGIYLVTFATAARRPLFADFDVACAASRTFEPSAMAGSAALLCWVLMPDHFHGLLRLDGGRSLSQAVQRLKSGSSRACTRAGTGPHVWARAFHDHALRRDEDVLGIARYIIGNPIRAGMVARANEYPFWNAMWL
jgi:REP element-mobilizing transposase RayT